MKRVLSFILTAAIFLSLAAFGSVAFAEEGEAPAEGEAPVEEPIVINFWSIWNSDEAYASILQTAAELYEVKTGVHVNIEWRGRDLSSYIAGSLEAGEGVDIFEDESKSISNYKQFTYDLTDMAAAAEYDSHSYAIFNDVVAQTAGYLNSIAEVPQVGAVFYDKEAFKAAGVTAVPETWAEFMDVCAKLKDAGYGPLALDSSFAHFLFYHQLVRYLGEDGVTALRDGGGWAANDGAVKAAQDMIDLTQAGGLVFGAPDEYPNSQNKLGYGLAAMIVGYDNVISEVEFMTGANMQWGAFKYPAVESGKDNESTCVSATSLAISRNCAHPREAFDFIMYLVTGTYDQDVANQYDLLPLDPTNAAPANRESTAELLKNAAKPMLWYGQLWAMPSWDTVSAMIVDLFRGVYATGADFCAAIDALYSVPEPEAPAE